MHVVCGVCGFWVIKGLSGLLSRLGENHLHLTSSESHAKPLCYLSSNDGLSYKHTAVYFFLHWNVQIGLGMGAHKGQYKPSFQLGHWLPTSRNLPISQICQHHWLGFSAEATQLPRLCAESEKQLAAQPHRDCCCSGDSQPAQRSLMLSGVPQHEM